MVVKPEQADEAKIQQEVKLREWLREGGARVTGWTSRYSLRLHARVQDTPCKPKFEHTPCEPKQYGNLNSGSNNLKEEPNSIKEALARIAE
jgi:hypothetical protein